MDSALLTFISQTYPIEPIIDWQPVLQGYLSRNYVLKTETAAYFLKTYRFESVERVQIAHTAKAFFAEGGIPIILPIQDQSGQPFFQCAGRFYSLFPYISGRHSVRGNLSQTMLQSMATTLAELHLLSRKDPSPVKRLAGLAWDKAALIRRADAILQIIANKRSLDDFDRLAEQSLSLKLSLARQNQIAYEDFQFTYDHLIHGDYHEANLFFDEADRVQAVFDLEKACLAPRVVEMVRSLIFTCFSDGTQGGCAFEDKNFADASIYLQAYHQRYPLHPTELKNGLRERYLGNFHSLWVEAEHYLNHNRRVDGFLEGSLRTLQYFSQYMEQFLEQIMHGVYGN